MTLEELQAHFDVMESVYERLSGLAPARRLSHRNDLCAMLLLEKLGPARGPMMKWGDGNLLIHVDIDAVLTRIITDDIETLLRCDVSGFDTENDGFILEV